jgi:hypothetical protein
LLLDFAPDAESILLPLASSTAKSVASGIGDALYSSAAIHTLIKSGTSTSRSGAPLIPTNSERYTEKPLGRLQRKLDS